MYKGINQYVVPMEDGWAVCCGDAKLHNPVIRFDSMDDAVEYARQAAIQTESQLLISLPQE